MPAGSLGFSLMGFNDPGFFQNRFASLVFGERDVAQR